MDQETAESLSVSEELLVEIRDLLSTQGPATPGPGTPGSASAPGASPTS